MIDHAEQNGIDLTEHFSAIVNIVGSLDRILLTIKTSRKNTQSGLTDDRVFQGYVQETQTFRPPGNTFEERMKSVIEERRTRIP